MGYPFSVYAVDLAKLKKVWGSEDDKLAAAIKKKQAERIEDNDESFADEIEEGEAPSLATCIDDIIAGKASNKEAGFQYGYALEVICQHLGKRIDQESFTWFDEFLDPHLKKKKQPNTAKLLGRDVHPIKIPKPDDFPEIGTIDDKGITALAKALAAIEEIEDIEDDVDVQEILTEVKGWVAAAKKAKKQIVWFIY